jgi:hypothetical protein
VPQYTQKVGLWDDEGIVLADGSYLFVPNNEHYENSAVMWFDEHNHPVDRQKLTPAEQTRIRLRRCYRMVNLVHTNRPQEYWTYAGVRMGSGKMTETPVLEPMVRELHAALGKARVKRVIHDRGFIDGERIAHCKRKLGIDILIPVRRDMDIYQDVLGLLKLNATRFQEYRPSTREPVDAARLPHSPERVRTRELRRQKTVKAKKAELAPKPPPNEVLLRREVAGFENLRTFTTCSVPLNVIVNRDVFADGHDDLWMLLDTKPLAKSEDPVGRREEYHLRTDIEEGHRQLKCFWDLTKFTSRAFSLVVNQVIFVALTYNLLQLHLKRQGREELNRRTLPRVYNQLLPNAAFIIIYCQDYFALFTSSEYTKILLTLPKKAQDKILRKTQLLEREMVNELRWPRPP